MPEPINPLINVNENIRGQAYKDALAQGLAASDRLSGELRTVLVNTAKDEQMPKGEKAEKLCELHSQLLGTNQAINALRMAEDTSSLLHFHNDDEASRSEHDGSVIRAEMPHQAIRRAMGGRWDPARLTSAQGLEFDFEGVMQAWRSNVFGADFITTDGVPPQVRRANVIDYAQIRQPQALDMFDAQRTTQNAVKYLRETIATSAVAERAEAAQAAEIDISYNEVTSAIRSIAGRLPVSEEQLADEPSARNLINRRLLYLAIRRLDTQVMAGNGTAPNLVGIANVTGIQELKHKRKNANTDRAPDEPEVEIYKGIQLIDLQAEGTATGAIIHPTVWADIRLAKGTDGHYVIGSPAVRDSRSIWGLPVALTMNGMSNITAWAANEHWAYVIDRNLAGTLFYRNQANVQFGRDDDDFGKFMWTARVNIRAAMTWTRPKAVVQIGSGGD